MTYVQLLLQAPLTGAGAVEAQNRQQLSMHSRPRSLVQCCQGFAIAVSCIMTWITCV
jgi:hypothetical protein